MGMPLLFFSTTISEREEGRKWTNLVNDKKNFQITNIFTTSLTRQLFKIKNNSMQKL